MDFPEIGRSAIRVDRAVLSRVTKARIRAACVPRPRCEPAKLVIRFDEWRRLS